MIIISQDKENIINVDNVTGIWIGNPLNNYNGEFSIETSADINDGLGCYKTEERAKEVLAEIINAYTGWSNLVAGQPNGECSPKYEMPEE